jgi:hypothetical protein
VEKRQVEAKPGCGLVASAKTSAVGPLSSDVLKELELGALGTITIRSSAEAERSASFRGMDTFEGNLLTHGIQNGKSGREKGRAIRFPAEVSLQGQWHHQWREWRVPKGRQHVAFCGEW